MLTLVVVVVVFGPSLWVRAVVRHYGKERPEIPGTGAELAKHLVEKIGLDGVQIEMTEPGSDHYSPAERMVRLSPAVHDGKSLSAIAIAAHEVGHAVQHQSAVVLHAVAVLLAAVHHQSAVQLPVAAVFLAAAQLAAAKHLAVAAK